MINRVVLVGRLTKDIELKKTKTNLSTCQFTLACDRKYKDEGGNKIADFISCIAWRQSADFLSQYARKGDVVGVDGTIQTRNYDGQNGKVYVTEVLCESVSLLSSKKDNQQVNQSNIQTNDNNSYDGYIDDDSPFY